MKCVEFNYLSSRAMSETTRRKLRLLQRLSLLAYVRMYEQVKSKINITLKLECFRNMVVLKVSGYCNVNTGNTTNYLCKTIIKCFSISPGREIKKRM